MNQFFLFSQDFFYSRYSREKLVTSVKYRVNSSNHFRGIKKIDFGVVYPPPQNCSKSYIAAFCTAHNGAANV